VALLLLSGCGGSGTISPDEAPSGGFDIESPEGQRLALDITWEKMSYSDRSDLCDGVNLFGADVAARMVTDSANESGDSNFDSWVVEAWLEEHC
jgi:hypothetical protein